MNKLKFAKIVVFTIALLFECRLVALAVEDFVDCSSWYSDKAPICQRTLCGGELLNMVGSWEGKFEYHVEGAFVPVNQHELYSTQTCFEESRAGDHFIVGLVEREFAATKDRAAYNENGLVIKGENSKTKQSFYREVNLKDGVREFVQVSAKKVSTGIEKSWKGMMGAEQTLSETVDESFQKRFLVLREKDGIHEKIISTGSLKKLPHGRISNFAGRIWVMQADGKIATQGRTLKKIVHDPVGSTVAEKGFFVEEGKDKSNSQLHFWSENRSLAKFTPGLIEHVRESTQEVSGKRKIKTIEVLQLDGSLYASRQLLDANGKVISSAVETGQSVPEGEFESKFRELLGKCGDCGTEALLVMLH